MLSLAIVYDVVLLAVGSFALVRGDRPERLGSLVFLAGSIASSFIRIAHLTSWKAGGPTLGIDAAAMAIFFWLGCRTTRFWPIWAFGLLLAIVSVDVAGLALPNVQLFVFASGQTLYAYLVLALIALGTFRTSRAPHDPHHGFRPPCPTPLSPMHDSL